MITTTCQENRILLTGDNLLRKVAAARAVHVDGVLWIIDEFHAADPYSAIGIVKLTRG